MKKIDLIMSVPNRRSPIVTTSDVKIRTQHVVMTCILAAGNEHTNTFQFSGDMA